MYICKGINYKLFNLNEKEFTQISIACHMRCVIQCILCNKEEIRLSDAYFNSKIIGTIIAHGLD